MPDPLLTYVIGPSLITLEGSANPAVCQVKCVTLGVDTEQLAEWLRRHLPRYQG